MKKNTLTFLESSYQKMRALVFSVPQLEGAAFLLCNTSETEIELRLLVTEVIAVQLHQYLERRADFLSLSSESYVQVAKRARNEKLSVFLVHSHPNGPLDFSSQDDREDVKLHEFLTSRIPGRVHGSLVVTDDSIVGRVSVERDFESIERIRIIGRRQEFFFADDAVSPSGAFNEYFDRQVRAFGYPIQRILKRLHIGVIGAGGTGSAVLEQLARLGVGEISIFDGDTLEASNVNRVYGSSTNDIGKSKAVIAGDAIKRIGLNTRTHVYPEHILSQSIAKKIRDCDLVFGCTDRELPRAILIQIMLKYFIPVIDMGVTIDSQEFQIKDVIGRVTVLQPGNACLFCRGRISAERMRIEALSDADRKAQIREGYAPELDMPAPAVIAFTSAVASLAITEFLQRLTGFMGATRTTTETLYQFDKSKIRKNSVAPAENCLCSDLTIQGAGDEQPFLGLVWMK